MLKIVCVKHGDQYSSDYVNKLYDMVMRNMTPVAGEFICFTEDGTGLFPEIRVKPLPEGLTGWWNKLYLFKDGLFSPGDRIVYFDLDTVIVGNLDKIMQYDGEFATLRDFYTHRDYGSAVMMWRSGFGAHIWQNWIDAGKPDRPHGDQQWIFEQYNKADILQDLHPGKFRSYKAECTFDFPAHTAVVCFHGRPRPHEVRDGWVPQCWKIGGGTAAEFLVVGNVSEEDLIKNIDHAMTLGLREVKLREAHGKHAVIVGGAPSVKKHLEEIRTRWKEQQIIFALNNSYKWLVDNGIYPDAHIILDARMENAAFVPEGAKPVKYYASQCHPNVFKKAPGAILWHGVEAQNVVKAETYIGGGSSVGLKALCLAYVLGYREMHIYGMDSSYQGETHHAYSQPLNDGERKITVNCNGKEYVCAPWMATQVNQFVELAPQLVQMGCTLTIHGEGLLPDVARALNKPAELNPVDLRVNEVLSRLPAGAVIGAEIGVFTGEMSRRLLKRPDLTLYMIDSWVEHDKDSEYHKTDFHGKLSAKDQERFYQCAFNVTAFAGDRAKIMRQTSAQGACYIKDGYLDFVFLDADHTYEAIKKDISAWYPKVKKNGLFGGHDYNHPLHPEWGVKRAVDEFCKESGHKLELGNDYTWFIKMGE